MSADDEKTTLDVFVAALQNQQAVLNLDGSKNGWSIYDLSEPEKTKISFSGRCWEGIVRQELKQLKQLEETDIQSWKMMLDVSDVQLLTLLQLSDEDTSRRFSMTTKQDSLPKKHLKTIHQHPVLQYPARVPVVIINNNKKRINTKISGRLKIDFEQVEKSVHPMYDELVRWTVKNTKRCHYKITIQRTKVWQSANNMFGDTWEAINLELI